ncbi:uncharacterized protein LOC106404011 [Brassica napus]|uniref:uncharacterized protein LOC106404011 n=1 Tax=Brassica napus TaxID=3708 RepID=UPI0006AA82AD|nr:uncharacterized protein LOC106404011 [Brassica napus]
MSSPLRVNSASSPSYVWSSISAARKLLLTGIRQKIHSGYEVKVWEDPWIPTTPARPALPIAPVMLPNMRVSDFINPVTKEWDVGLLENYVNPEDIPLIRSLAISSAHRRDTFCWNYTRNDQYTVKSGYWVAQNVLKAEEEKEVLEPITRNLARRNMRCDNYCPRCGELEESVTHAIFECPLALQVWSLSSTPSSPASAQFSGCGWVWWDSGGNIQLLGTKNFDRRESALHSEVEALRWAMENMLQHSTCQSFGTDCKELIAMIKEPHVWPSFATEL